jgi:quercetin dioxygenase-like cupin family protein
LFVLLSDTFPIVSELVPAASWSSAGEGEHLWFLGTLATIKVTGEASDGRFALIDFLFPRHTSPPLRTHPQDESYVVLEGRLTIQAGEQRFDLEAGAAAVVPMGVPHTFRVDSDGARALVLSTPAGARTNGPGRLDSGRCADFAAQRRASTFAGAAGKHLPGPRPGQPRSATGARRLMSSL